MEMFSSSHLLHVEYFFPPILFCCFLSTKADFNLFCLIVMLRSPSCLLVLTSTEEVHTGTRGALGFVYNHMSAAIILLVLAFAVQPASDDYDGHGPEDSTYAGASSDHGDLDVVRCVLC